MEKENNKITVLPAMQTQLSRIFGEKSKIATKTNKSIKDWKKTLRSLLDELEAYIDANIVTDSLHRMMIYYGLYSADKSLEEDNFWPGFIEGIMRISFLLIGDYPDHRMRRGGRKKNSHYKLNRCRSIVYTQNYEQQRDTLLFAWNSNSGILENNPRQILRSFRSEFGFKAGIKDFILWYKEHHPKDYAKIF